MTGYLSCQTRWLRMVLNTDDNFIVLLLQEYDS
jgi:hypothetical protein